METLKIKRIFFMKVLHNIKISSTFAASIKEMMTFDGEIAQLVRAHDS